MKGFTFDKKWIASLKQHLEKLNREVGNLKVCAEDNFKSQIADVKLYYGEVRLLCDNLSLISEFFKESDNLTRTYNKCSKACHAHFNDIFSHLQFNDLIKQKLDHLAAINQWALDELSAAGKDGASFPYISLTKEITTLYILLLDLVKNEYHYAFEEIRMHFIEVKKEMREIARVTWNDEEVSAPPHKQLLKLPEHIAKCSAFTSEIENKVEELNAEKEFINKNDGIQQLLNAFSGQEGFDYASAADDEEKLNTIKHIEAIFTMEKERQLLKKVMNDFGYANLSKERINEESQEGQVDIF